MEHARSAGEMLARLHRAAESFGAPSRKPRPLVASFTIFASQNATEGLEQYLASHARCSNTTRQTREDCASGLDSARSLS